MKVLELFAGSRSVGKACEELGYEVYSSDINAFPGIDYVTDIRDFDIDKVPFVPDTSLSASATTAPLETLYVVSCDTIGAKYLPSFSLNGNLIIVLIIRFVLY